jgi:hypothetical protein
MEDAEKKEELTEKERVDKCAKEIEAVLKKYHCTIDFTLTLSRNGMEPNLKIVPSLNLPETVF